MRISVYLWVACAMRTQRGGARQPCHSARYTECPNVVWSDLDAFIVCLIGGKINISFKRSQFILVSDPHGGECGGNRYTSYISCFSLSQFLTFELFSQRSWLNQATQHWLHKGASATPICRS